MKTILAQAPQASGYPLKIVEAFNAEEQSPVVPLNQESKLVVPTAKPENITNSPEKWDESWFANYE